jgi:hypothetical protein
MSLHTNRKVFRIINRFLEDIDIAIITEFFLNFAERKHPQTKNHNE